MALLHLLFIHHHITISHRPEAEEAKAPHKRRCQLLLLAAGTRPLQKLK